MKARHARIGHDGRRHVSRLGAIVVVSAFAHGSATWGQCSNDAGTGDIAEGEVCAGDFYDDTTNGGCNTTPAVFSELSAADFALAGSPDEVLACGRGSTYRSDADGDGTPDTNNRDTDWYRIDQATLASFDADGNGTVRVTSDVTAEFDTVTFMISVDNLVDCNANVLKNVGCWDAGSGTGTQASNVITISENPSGVIVFVAPGRCNGSGIYEGIECSTRLNDYVVTIAVDPLFEDGTFTACGDPAQNPQLGPCGVPNPGVNGCEDPECCAVVCTEYTPFCCTHELGWIQQCADAAIDLGCATECCDGPICLETGPDSSADGYCKICADPYGSWTSDTFGGGGPGDSFWGDEFNPIDGPGAQGALDLQEASFTNGFYFFQRDGDGTGITRELLSTIIDWQQVFAPDASVQRTLLGNGIVPFDDDDDGVFDRFESEFNLFSAPLMGAGLDLDFQLTQVLESTPCPVAVLTQTLVITNNHADPVDFTLVRSMDGDLVWDAMGDIGDDSVGTNTNGSPLDRYVFQGETGLPGTYITISSDQAGVYFGAKAGVDPDGAGPCPPMESGSDLPLWNAYGVPCAWENYIAGVGADVNGESGPAPPACTVTCDASIGLEIPVAVPGSGASTTVIVQTTYGAASPLGIICDPCLWDCGDFNGDIGIVDFLALLGQWGQIGSTCDLGIGAPGVGIEEFLGLLANWGPCP